MPFLGLFFNTKNRTNVLSNLCNLLIEHRRRSYWFLPQEEEKRNFWEKDEIKTFLEKAHSQLEQQDYVMFYVLIFTGMRKGELLALEWRDVDLKEKTINIKQTMFFEDGKEVIQTTKKYHSKRIITIDYHTAQILTKWRT
ncbi:site-specific integrase [Bacillus paralicheniformis]|uniref:site-specific integrase n=1 Tax=Bacillus paralicheniformis TaxID=1648923 RepID=UPI000AC02F13|nr:site-specific integrase [Bacillus paralicheniformis]